MEMQSSVPKLWFLCSDGVNKESSTDQTPGLALLGREGGTLNPFQRNEAGYPTEQDKGGRLDEF